jgi:hypothetical protein
MTSGQQGVSGQTVFTFPVDLCREITQMQIIAAQPRELAAPA